jgi:hypothetical protein
MHILLVVLPRSPIRCAMLMARTLSPLRLIHPATVSLLLFLTRSPQSLEVAIVGMVLSLREALDWTRDNMCGCVLCCVLLCLLQLCSAWWRD